VSTNSTTEAYAADAVHIMRQWQSRQLLNAKNPRNADQLHNSSATHYHLPALCRFHQ
jgi:hypothetical protein